MTKFKIIIEKMKSLIGELSPFSNGKTSVSITIGYQAGKDGNIPSTATIVSGGNMLTKGFLVSGEDGTNCTFAVNAGEFIKTASALIAYEETIEFSVSDSTVTLAAGEHASIPLSLLTNTETPLPFDLSKAKIALLLDTDKFLAFSHKGCFLHNDSDPNNVADRVVVKLTLTGDGIMQGYSMDGFAFATASMSLKPKDEKQQCGYIIKPYWNISLLKEKADTLVGKEQSSFNEKIQAAVDSLSEKNLSPLLNLCKQEGINTSEYSFSLLYNSFDLMKKVVKGNTFFQVALTDTYCIVRTSTSTAVFTLGSTVPTIYNVITGMVDKKPLTETAIDTQAFMKGLSLMLLHSDISNDKKPVLLNASESGLFLNYGESRSKMEYVDKAGSINEMSIYMMATLLKKVVSNMNNGNLYLAFYGKEKPVLVRNGSINDENKNYVIVLPVRSSAVSEDKNSKSKE